MTTWKVKVHPSDGTCDHCGGTEDVILYEHADTGEKRRVCNPCEQAAGAVRRGN